MFDLEKSIREWRLSLNKNEALEDGAKEELEGHLRDKIEHLFGRGLSREDAFREAVERIGKADVLGGEFFKQRTRGLNGTPPWSRKSRMPLLSNYLKIGLRKIRRQTVFSLINITGLAAGLACCAVIILYVANELTYDRYHDDAGRIFRVNSHRANMVGEFWSARTPGPLGEEIRAAFPQVENVVRLVPPYENADHVLVVRGDRRFFENRVFFTDNSIFQMFKIPFIRGSSKSALIDPHTVVISQDMAVKYFGDESALGQVLRIEVDYDTGNVELQDYTVTGVVRNAPANTHLKYDMLMSFPSLIANLPSFESDWLNPKTKYTYVKLSASADAADFEKKIQVFPDVESRMYKEKYNREFKLNELELMPVPRIHMFSQYRRELESPGSWTYIYIYSLVAFLILLIGCMNFINLSAALSTTRAREVGLRKVLGAGRRQLVGQFLGEAFLVTSLAFVVAFGLIALLLYPFNRMAGTELTMAGLTHLPVMFSLLALLLVVGIGSGCYPAFILNASNPASVLQGRSSLKSRGSAMQRVLVVGQFAISIFLVICTLTVFHQLRFMRGRSLGFDLDQKLILRVKSHLPHLRRDYEVIKQDFLRHPSIKGATVSSSAPGDGDSGGYYLTAKAGDFSGTPFINVITLDYDFLELYGVKMAAGRPFQRGLGNDAEESFLVNRTAARELGFASPEEALGKRFQAHYHRKTKRIVGVTEDFHYNGMREAVDPLVLDIEGSLMDTITLSIRADNMRDLMRFVTETWETQFSGVPFEYAFLDQNFDRVYRYEEQMGRLLGIITTLGFIIACLGLFGLAAFVVQSRVKEIGIRKVLGASSRDIVGLLSRKFVVLILLSVGLASPLALYAMRTWLQNFAYRVDMPAVVFVFAAAAAMTIALGTVGLQGFRAASANPVDSLRNE